MTHDELIAECAARESAALVERDDSARYAAWQRSPEGEAHRAEWIGGGPESGEADAAMYAQEARFFAALRTALEAARDHRCGPAGLDQALNSGDGTYRP